MKKIIFLLIAVLVIISSVFPLDIYKKIIQPGEALVGSSYRSGGTTPSGFDCSGFVTYLYKKYVPGIPRISRDMAEYGEPVKRDSIVPGDLLFFATGSSSTSITHVAIYIGQNSILHSISNGPNRGVTITSLSARYWKTRYIRAARLIKKSISSSGINTGSTDADGNKRVVRNMQFAKGVYSGEMINGEPDGQGTLVMNNGDRYEGFFKAGMFEGKGTYYWADGKSQGGEFKEGRLLGATNKEENYMLKKDSPWETWDGIVDGDFRLWLQKDKDAFEEWKKKN